MSEENKVIPFIGHQPQRMSPDIPLRDGRVIHAVRYPMMECEHIEKPHPAGMGGLQHLFKFPNGFGASVICAPESYGHRDGLWELAVLKYEPDEEIAGGKLIYTTPITDDVIGHLNPEEVKDLLLQIAQLNVSCLEGETECKLP